MVCWTVGPFEVVVLAAYIEALVHIATIRRVDILAEEAGVAFEVRRLVDVELKNKKRSGLAQLVMDPSNCMRTYFLLVL